MTSSMSNAFVKHNDFDNICNNSPKKSNGLTDFLKVTTSNGNSDIYDGEGNRLSVKNEEEMYNKICIRT
jgi:hypothetical protein